VRATRHSPLTAEEVKKLRSLGITSSDRLWDDLGSRPDGGVDDLAARTSIGRDRLLDALISLAERDVSFAGGLRRTVAEGRIALARVSAAWRDHWLEVAALLAVGFFAVLTWRALHIPTTVAVAAHKGVAGRLLQGGDVSSARLPADSTTFTDVDQVRGLVLRRGVFPGQILRFEDVARLQLVAVRDIPSGSLVAADAIAVTWSPYHPDAFTDPARAIGRRSRRTIKSGDVVLGYDVDPGAGPTPRAP
jgi:flagella basal body P-ring formation protein FlgA